MPALTLRPFVVTGTARSGTAYAAMLLSGLGLRIGHEDVFGPRTRSFDGWQGQDGDSSWLAAPFLDQLPDALVLHQLRHPLKVVRSLVGVRFFADRSRLFLDGDDAYTRTKWKVRESLMRAGHVPESDHGPRPHKVYRAFLDTYDPGLWRFHTEAERALAYWVEWTHRIREHAGDERYRCYQLEQLDAEHLSKLLGDVGLVVTPGHVAHAMTKVRPDLNSKRVAHGLQWSDLPAGPMKSAAEELAAVLGYDVREPLPAAGGESS